MHTKINKTGTYTPLTETGKSRKAGTEEKGKRGKESRESTKSGKQTEERKEAERKGQYAAIAEKTGDPDRGTGDFHFRADPAWKQRGGIFRV